MNLTIGPPSNCYRQIIQSKCWHLGQDTQICQVSNWTNICILWTWNLRFYTILWKTVMSFNGWYTCQNVNDCLILNHLVLFPSNNGLKSAFIRIRWQSHLHESNASGPRALNFRNTCVGIRCNGKFYFFYFSSYRFIIILII